MGIRISHLRKQFASFTALDDITLDVRQGELLALLGPSGSGKTTLLRIMAGLEHADGGQVLFGDEDATRMSVQSRRVGFVFQHYALFKHMDVFENIAFGLRVRRGRSAGPKRASAHAWKSCWRWCSCRAWSSVTRPSCLVGSVSAWRWRARWPLSRACCCWTSPLVPWMHRCAATCAAGCANCTSKPA